MPRESSVSPRSLRQTSHSVGDQRRGTRVLYNDCDPNLEWSGRGGYHEAARLPMLVPDNPSCWRRNRVEPLSGPTRLGFYSLEL